MWGGQGSVTEVRLCAAWQIYRQTLDGTIFVFILITIYWLEYDYWIKKHILFDAVDFFRVIW